MPRASATFHYVFRQIGAVLIKERPCTIITCAGGEGAEPVDSAAEETPFNPFENSNMTSS